MKQFHQLNKQLIGRELHRILILLEIGLLIVLVGMSVCSCLPLSDRCYEAMPSMLRFRLAKGQDALLGKITQCRVYCSTKQFDDMRDNTNVVVSLNKLKSCDEVEISLPTGLLNFRIDFYYRQSRELPMRPPVFQEISLNGNELVRDWFHECRLEKIGAVGWSYVKKPYFKGYLVELVLCGALVYVAVFVVFIMFPLLKVARSK